MALVYQETARLKRGLQGGVSAVAFSPDGTYIAAAGLDDKKVYIWHVADQRLLHTYTGSQGPVLSLEWVPGRVDSVLCGSTGGYVSELRFTSTISEVSGFWAHGYPVEHLSANGPLLVSGAQPEVSVWVRRNGAWMHLRDLDGPPTDSTNVDKEYIVMGIHWTKTRFHRSVVALAYAHHGIIVYNKADWNLIHVIPLCDIGGSSVSPLGTMLALSIVGSGFNVYDVVKGECVASFPDESGGELTIPVLFVHGGHALLGGSTVGLAHLWNASNGRVHQTFCTGGQVHIRAISANYNAELDRFLLAAGVSDLQGNADIIIWTARDGQPRGRKTGLTYCLLILGTALAVLALFVALSRADVWQITIDI